MVIDALAKAMGVLSLHFSSGKIILGTNQEKLHVNSKNYRKLHKKKRRIVQFLWGRVGVGVQLMFHLLDGEGSRVLIS